jgi:hypothetical protein
MRKKTVITVIGMLLETNYCKIKQRAYLITFANEEIIPNTAIILISIRGFTISASIMSSWYAYMVNKIKILMHEGNGECLHIRY